MGQFPFLQLRWVWALPVLPGVTWGLGRGCRPSDPKPTSMGLPTGQSYPWGVPGGPGRWDSGEIPVPRATGPQQALVLYGLPCF